MLAKPKDQVMSWLANETFEIFVDDDRYAVPTLHLVPVEGEAVALKIARRLLAESPHHLGVELCQDGRRLVGLGSLACRRAALSGAQAGASASG